MQETGIIVDRVTTMDAIGRGLTFVPDNGKVVFGIEIDSSLGFKFRGITRMFMKIRKVLHMNNNPFRTVVLSEEEAKQFFVGDKVTLNIALEK